MAIDWQQAIKEKVDPTNIFAINNTIARSDEERANLAAVTERRLGKPAI